MKLSKIHLAILIILAILTILIFAISDNNSINNKEISQVCFKQNCFSLELAKTQAEKERGLMYRESLDSNKGMLFIYNTPSKPGFWMKNTLIPLDIIWLDQEGKIVHIVTAQPCTQDPCQIYSPDSEASYVLEINAGLSETLGIKEGDVAEFK